MELGVIISLCGLALSAATFFIGRISAGNKSGREDGQMHSDMGYIKSGVDGLRGDIKEFRAALEKVRIDQATQGRDIESAFRRIKALEERMAHYHEGGS